MAVTLYQRHPETTIGSATAKVPCTNSGTNSGSTNSGTLHQQRDQKREEGSELQTTLETSGQGPRW